MTAIFCHVFGGRWAWIFGSKKMETFEKTGVMVKLDPKGSQPTGDGAKTLVNTIMEK